MISYYIYILQSDSSKVFYVGYSADPWRRTREHNIKPFNTYSSKHRPWKLRAVFYCGNAVGEARKLENFIKKQKSRKLLEQLIDPSFVPVGTLAQLVRVPDLRD